MECGLILETLLDVGLGMVDVCFDCIIGGSFRLLWNGEESDVVTPSLGVRQGDPITHIVVLCSSAFHI